MIGKRVLICMVVFFGVLFIVLLGIIALRIDSQNQSLYAENVLLRRENASLRAENSSFRQQLDQKKGKPVNIDELPLGNYKTVSFPECDGFVFAKKDDDSLERSVYAVYSNKSIPTYFEITVLKQ